MEFDFAAADRLLSTTRAVRKRLDFDRPVPRAVVDDCLRLAMQASTGSNRQEWRCVVVSDADRRARLGDIYRKGVGQYPEEALAATRAAGDTPATRIFDSARYLTENIQRAPVHVIACMEREFGDIPEGLAPIGAMGSVFPAVWSFQLALRARGLGTCPTTLHPNFADEAAALHELPDDFIQVALLPVAYTLGPDFKPARRRPFEETVRWERWGQLKRAFRPGPETSPGRIPSDDHTVAVASPISGANASARRPLRATRTDPDGPSATSSMPRGGGECTFQGPALEPLSP
jgi:nitroreductase